MSCLHRMKHSNFKFGFIKVSFLAQVSHLVNSNWSKCSLIKFIQALWGAVTSRGHSSLKIAFYCIYKLLHNQNLLLVYNYIEFRNRKINSTLKEQINCTFEPWWSLCKMLALHTYLFVVVSVDMLGQGLALFSQVIAFCVSLQGLVICLINLHMQIQKWFHLRK